MMLHIAHVSKFDYENAIVASTCTDVMLLCPANCHKISTLIFQRYMYGITENRVQNIDISFMSNALGTGVCEALLGLHVFTRCDSVSSFAGKGKLSALQLGKKMKSTNIFFSAFGITRDVSETVADVHLCSLWCQKVECNINAQR